VAGLSVIRTRMVTTAVSCAAVLLLVNQVGLLVWAAVWFVTLLTVLQLVRAAVLKVLQVANGTWVAGWPAPMVATSTAAAISAAHYSYTAMPAVTAVLEHS
jgi:hypothetical protein